MLNIRRAGGTLTARSLAINGLNGGQGNDTLDTTDAFLASDRIDGAARTIVQ